MIIYSVTVSIDKLIQEDWLGWMQEKHIPDVMATGYFQEYAIQEIIDPQPQPGSLTYNIQYLCENMEAYQSYQQSAASALQKEHTERYKDRFVAFRTVLRRL